MPQNKFNVASYRALEVDRLIPSSGSTVQISSLDVSGEMTADTLSVGTITSDFLMANNVFQAVAPPPPTITVTRTKAELEAILQNTFDPYNVGIFTHDVYGLPTKEDIQNFVTIDTIDKLMYRTQQYDCDDFAQTLVGNAKRWYHNATPPQPCGLAFGTIIRPGHMKNFFVDDQERVWMVEPQNDNISLYNPATFDVSSFYI